MFDVLESDPAAAMMLLLAAQTVPAVFLRVVAAELYNGSAGSELIVGIVQFRCSLWRCPPLACRPAQVIFGRIGISQARSAAASPAVHRVLGWWRAVSGGGWRGVADGSADGSWDGEV